MKLIRNQDRDGRMAVGVGPIVFAAALSLVFVSSAFAAQEQVVDGGFEAGSPAWVLEHGMQRCEANTTCGPVGAASGSFYVATPTFTSVPPMAGAVEDGTITQLVSTPELPASLSFKLRSIPIGALSMQLQVKYAGEVIDEIDSAGESFESETAAIPAPLAGPTARPLTFSVTCFNLTASTGQCPRFDLDDVSLLTGTTTTTSPPPSGSTPTQGGGTSEDVTPPETTLGPFKKSVTVKSKVARAKVKLRFSTSEAGGHFECKLDRGRYSACSSPRTLRLKVGRHSFWVRAVDASGNEDPSPAKATILVKVANG